MKPEGLLPRSQVPSTYQSPEQEKYIQWAQIKGV